MLAAVLTMLWRQVPSVQELTRMLAREDLLWSKAVEVSQQAVSQRFVSFPAQLFERLFMELLSTWTGIITRQPLIDYATKPYTTRGDTKAAV